MASLKLTQTKTVVGSRYGVQSLAFNATPEKLRNCFVVQPTGDATYERLVGVADAADLDDVGEPVNPLNRWYDASVSLVSAIPGDILRVLSPRAEWDPALPSYLEFGVTGVDGTRAVVDDAFWCVVPAGAWELRRGASVILTGTTGSAQRQNTAALLYRADRWVGVYDEPADALDHLSSVSFGVKQLVSALSLSPAEFLAAAPGNPINSTFEG
jgi:hypothetical protein